MSLVKDCIYKEEHYSVRDDGSVLRHPRVCDSPRPTDNQWTLGKPNEKTGYMEIASVRVHRIVATAYYGIPPTKEHVVDHIDTNKRNNRPENLRWVTRLENILLNPITVKRIELACSCTIEEFLADPSKFRGKFQEPNYEWMCAVSKQEAQSSLERMLAWAMSDARPSGGKLGEWIYDKDKTLNTIKSVRPSIDEIFDRVEKEKGVNKIELSSKSKKHKNLKARIYAAKLFRSEIGLSDEKISALVGRSPSMVNTYIRWQEEYSTRL